MRRFVPLFASLLAATCWTFGAPAAAQRRTLDDDRFRQLDELLPTPNVYRTASGAPGHEYWQQRVDYRIDVVLDEQERRLTGSETITYSNHSPDELAYLWLQLDQNRFAPDAAGHATSEAPDFERFRFGIMKHLLVRESFQGGYQIRSVTDAGGAPLAHTVNGTMMRIDLPEPLQPGAQTSFSIEWTNLIPDARAVRARGGYEHFDEDGNDVFGLAQWFPRLAVYSDATGWQNKQFLGAGEFALEFGDYEVSITVPADHVLAATGELQNPEQVLTAEQRERLERARTSDAPLFVVTPDEALANQAERSTETRTWHYVARDVRDFAWASSRKFIWDAVGHEVGGRTVMCMSLYPNEGEPLWSKYSTHAVVHTLDVYSRFTFDYPYPVAISVCGPVGGGMEYPMICFNGPRPEADGTYSERTKYGLISVIIHEVGHNYFPMIVSSDERQWTWMDEGLNTFCQYLAEQEWEDDYPSRGGDPRKIVDYMSSTEQVPIMTNSESILQFGPNAYSKPATALNVLRETVMGRELFDFAFKTYARRWMFKHPEPADLFRTLEDASAVDLDWFWRGWFYTTDHVDIGIRSVHHWVLDPGDPEASKALDRQERDAEPTSVTAERNRDLPKRIASYPELGDFYNEFDALAVTETDRRDFDKYLADLDEDERELLAVERHFYALELENHGGIPMPVILELHYADGTKELKRIPAELWRKHPDRVTKLLMTTGEIEAFVLDPHRETADTDHSNNRFPPELAQSRFKLFKEKQEPNPMQRARAAAAGGEERGEEGGAGGEAEEGAGQNGEGEGGDQ